jgi:hypothetical protein
MSPSVGVDMSSMSRRILYCVVKEEWIRILRSFSLTARARQICLWESQEVPGPLLTSLGSLGRHDERGQRASFALFFVNDTSYSIQDTGYRIQDTG